MSSKFKASRNIEFFEALQPSDFSVDEFVRNRVCFVSQSLPKSLYIKFAYSQNWNR